MCSVEKDQPTSTTKCGFWSIERSEISNLILGECVKSPPFQLGCCAEDNWYIQLYPKGCQLTSKDYVSIFLCRTCECSQRLKYSFMLFYSSSDYLGCETPMRKAFCCDLVRWGYHQFGRSEKLFSPNADEKIAVFYEVRKETSSNAPQEFFPKSSKGLIGSGDTNIQISTNDSVFQMLVSEVDEGGMAKLLVDAASWREFRQYMQGRLQETFPNMDAANNYFQQLSSKENIKGKPQMTTEDATLADRSRSHGTFHRTRGGLCPYWTDKERTCPFWNSSQAKLISNTQPE